MKSRAVHPPLIAAFFVLSVYSANAALIPLVDLVRPLLVAVGVTLGVWLVTGLLLRSAERSALVASVCAAGFFGYASFADGLGFEREEALLPWAFTTVVIAGLMAWKWRWTAVLNVFALCIFTVASAQIGLLFWRTGHARSSALAGVPEAKRLLKRPPDVFYIILDGYGRSDQLLSKMRYDNRPFIEALQQRGFRVVPGATSNYVQTELSLAATLNFQFLSTLYPQFDADLTDRREFRPAIDEPEVFRVFKRLGYITIGISTLFPSVEFNGADLKLNDSNGFRLIESALVQMTPLSVVGRPQESMYPQRRRSLRAAFVNMQRLATPGAKPRLVVAHVLAPHPPFVFDAQGRDFRQKGPFGYVDGSDYIGQTGDADDYRSGYAGQAEYLNKLLLETIDRLLAVKGQKPIIVLQGDHGSKVGLDQNSLQRTDVEEAFAVLSAFYAPPEVTRLIDDRMSNVNTFRVILKGLFGFEMTLAPDRSWYSTYPLPLDFTEVTGPLRRASASLPPEDHRESAAP